MRGLRIFHRVTPRHVLRPRDLRSGGRDTIRSLAPAWASEGIALQPADDRPRGRSRPGASPQSFWVPDSSEVGLARALEKSWAEPGDLPRARGMALDHDAARASEGEDHGRAMIPRRLDDDDRDRSRGCRPSRAVPVFLRARVDPKLGVLAIARAPAPPERPEPGARRSMLVRPGAGAADRGGRRARDIEASPPKMHL